MSSPSHDPLLLRISQSLSHQRHIKFIVRIPPLNQEKSLSSVEDDRSFQQAPEARRLPKSTASSQRWRSDPVAAEEVLPAASSRKSVLGP
jgi:hypothetical protein